VASICWFTVEQSFGNRRFTRSNIIEHHRTSTHPPGVDMTAAFHPIATRTHRVEVSSPPYGRRRAVAAALLAVVVVLLAFAVSTFVDAAIDVGGRPAAASGVEPASETPIVRVHVAQSGDTLWSIADRYRGEVGHDRYVDALIDLNGGTAIQVGQAVRLP
jgi:hypothetical protein